MIAEQPPHHVSVVDPIGPSITWVKQVLFRPFDMERWFVIGFCAWLATLGANLGGGGGGNNSGMRIENARHELPGVEAWIQAHLWWLILAGTGLLLLGFTLYLVLLWLRCRGRFMFLHCVRHCVAEVRRPWSLYRHLARSLFLFRLVLGVLSFVAIAIPTAIFLVTLWPLSKISPSAMLVPLLLYFPTIVMFGLILGAVGKLTHDFVVPLMVLRQTTCRSAWSELLSLIGRNKARFVLYLFFQLIIQMVINLGLIALFMITCCVACCLFNLPYLGTVLFLPIPVFNRAYPLLYLRQYGPAYDVFYQPPEAKSD